MPKRERYVWVCVNRRPDGNPKGSCAQKGSEALHSALKNAVAEAGLHKRVRVMTSSCTDLCWVGATATVMPDMAFLKHLTVDDVPAVVEALGRPENVAESAALSDKIVQPTDFDEPRLVAKIGTRREP
jgi:(2Fe-2S) ferredoxin